jgi:hypothetical protein
MSGSARWLVFSSIALVASTSKATVIWTGDYQTGSLSQWSSKEIAHSSDLQIVTSPTPGGDTYAMQVTLNPGDIVDDGNRAEVDYTGDEPAEGALRYYHWQTYFPSDFDSANTWQLFTQWHHTGNDGSPPLQILTEGNQIELDNTDAVAYWSTPLVLGTWHDFIVHVLWSSDATVGGVEVWYDGQHVLPFTNGATLFSGMSIYLKQGLYRNSDVDYTQVLYHCGTTVATELSDVMPGAAADAGSAPPPDAGSEVVDAGAPPEADGGSHSHEPSDGGGRGHEPDDAGPGGAADDAGSIIVGRGIPWHALTDAGSSAVDGGEADGSSPIIPLPGHHLGCSSFGEVYNLSLLVFARWLTRRRRSGSTISR